MINDKYPGLVSITEYKDSRGIMGVVQDDILPFRVMRVFYIAKVPERVIRGGHAHFTSKQFLVCIHGRIEIELEDFEGTRYTYRLDSAQQQGLYLPPLCWGHYDFHEGAVALCLASDHFKEEDYIRDYKEFEKIKHANSSH